MKATNWVAIKTVLLIVIGVLTLAQEYDMYKEVPPVFIYPIVSLFTFIFSIVFFKGSSMNNKLSKGNFRNSPLKLFSDPLPFYHLVAFLSIISGGCGIIKAMITNSEVDPFSYFFLFIGLPILISVYIANRRFLKKK